MAFIRQSSTGCARSIPLCSSSASFIALDHPLPFTSRRTFSWWWKRGAKDWSFSLDDSFQRHMLRKQRLLRYKYSKALRRRQLWDKDPVQVASRPTWGWQTADLSSPNDGQSSSSQPSPPDSGSRQKTTGQQAIDDFTHFKAWVDKDPFHAVFGRRLASHQNPTNASWSSFSWILDPKPLKDGHKIPHESAVSNTPPTSRPSSISSSNVCTTPRPCESSPDKYENRSTSTIEPSRRAANSADRKDEYEFDPISMRKVLKSTLVVETPPNASKLLFDPLFAEKGVDIPVKPYKPHRVFGYSAKASTGRSETKEPSSASSASKLKAETSRLTELRKLKAATLGNSIDTTAEYHGKWVPAAENAREESTKESAADPTAEEAPLFSGTTYEVKSKDILTGIKRPKQDWLKREGFGTKQEASVSTRHDGNPSKADLQSENSTSKLQPSLDRLRVIPRASDRLGPSLDRLKASEEKPIPSHSSQKPVVAPGEAQGSTTEDPELLRASDIEASTRTSRSAKQDSERIKQDRRQKPENDLKSRQKDDDGLSIVLPNVITESSQKLSESLNNLWHRVRAQQKAWLAHKLPSLSSMQENHRAQEAPISEVQAPPNVRRAATRPIQTFTPSKEVLDAEQQSKDRTLALRKARLEATRLEVEMKEKEKALARTIKATYEDEYGPITVEHRQIKGLARIDQLAGTIKEANARADQNAIREMIIRCEHALRHARVTRAEVTQKIRAMHAQLPSPKAISPSLSWRTTSDLVSMKSASEENVAVEGSAEKPGFAARQTSSASPEVSASKTPLLYKVLAYDSSTLQMNIAETTSSVPATADAESQPLHPTDVFSRLNNVAKFLPYFADMEKQGYEIVSGSGDVLVFKKVRAPTYSPNTTAKPSSPITEASPKASTLSQELTLAENVVEPLAPNASSSKVRRQEDVFSGSGQTWHQEEGGSSSSSNRGTEPGWFRRTIKRVFLAGTLTAAMAYTIGVAAERAGAQGQGVRPRRSGRPGIYSTEDSR